MLRININTFDEKNLVVFTHPYSGNPVSNSKNQSTFCLQPVNKITKLLSSIAYCVVLAAQSTAVILRNVVLDSERERKTETGKHLKIKQRFCFS